MKPVHAILTLLLALACRGTQEENPESAHVLARVGDLTLTREELRTHSGAGPEAGWSSEQERLLLEDWVTSSLFYLAAAESGLDRDPEIERKIESMTRSFLAQEYMRRVASTARVDESEVLAVYEADRDLFDWEINLILITCKTMEHAENVISTLDGSPGGFENALESIEEDPEVEVSRTGYINLGGFAITSPAPLREMLAELEPQVTSPPVPASGGYVMVRIIEQRTCALAPEDARSMIRSALLARRRETKLDSLHRELQNRYPVELSGGHQP
jgi:hypothetical protein